MLSAEDSAALCRLFNISVPVMLPPRQNWAPWAIAYLRTLQNWSA